MKSLCVAPSSFAITVWRGVRENAQFMEKTKVRITANGKRMGAMGFVYLEREFIGLAYLGLYIYGQLGVNYFLKPLFASVKVNSGWLKLV